MAGVLRRALSMCTRAVYRYSYRQVFVLRGSESCGRAIYAVLPTSFAASRSAPGPLMLHAVHAVPAAPAQEMLTWQVPFATDNQWQLVRFVSEGGRLPIPPREELPGRDTAGFTGAAMPGSPSGAAGLAA